MENIKELEIINIYTKDGKLMAIVSYLDLDKLSKEGNGYSITEIPFNLRDLKLSSRGNILKDQSIKD